MVNLMDGFRVFEDIRQIHHFSLIHLRKRFLNFHLTSNSRPGAGILLPQV